MAPLGTALTEEQLEELWRLVAGAGPVLRRRCRRRPRRGARPRNWRCRCWHRTARLRSGQPARRRGPRHAGSPPAAPDALRGGPGCRRARWPTRSTTCCAKARRRDDAGAARGVPGAARAAAGESRTRPSPSEYREALRGQVLRRATPEPGHGAAARSAARSPAVPRAQPAAGAASPAERARILTAILLRHPILLRDVEHAYAGARPAAPRSRCCAMRSRVGGNGRNP